MRSGGDDHNRASAFMRDRRARCLVAYRLCGKLEIGVNIALHWLFVAEPYVHDAKFVDGAMAFSLEFFSRVVDTRQEADRFMTKNAKLLLIIGGLLIAAALVFYVGFASKPPAPTAQQRGFTPR